MSFQSEWMVGLQAYAYDVNEEGAGAVVEAAELAAANVVFLAVSYSDSITTQDPDRAPRLVHNPVRARHAGEAFVRPAGAAYPPGLEPPIGADAALDGGAAYRALREAAAGRRITIVPWLLALSQRVALGSPAHAVINARGAVVPGWLCPSRPGTLDFVEALVGDIVQQFEPPAVFIDGARFPEPRAGRIADGCGCFCDACAASARRAGLDLEAVRQDLLPLLEAAETRPADVASRVIEGSRSGFRALRAAATRRRLLEWLDFRHAAIDRVIATARRAVDGRSELWLDVWPPTYGWLLGQDLARLARHATWTRPFTYHRWGGGADIPGLIRSLSDDGETQQALYEAFLAFFRFPGPETFAGFMERGLDAAFITEETRFLIELLAGRSRSAAGLQIWQMGRDGVAEALERAKDADPDGVILHCYGWATQEELGAAGEWVRARAPARG